MEQKIGWQVLGWMLGLPILLVGLINTFWGNDMVFGLFIALGAFVYMPPGYAFWLKKTKIKLPVALKLVMFAVFIWVVLGVGELPNKVDMMLADLR